MNNEIVIKMPLGLVVNPEQKKRIEGKVNEFALRTGYTKVDTGCLLQEQEYHFYLTRPETK